MILSEQGVPEGRTNKEGKERGMRGEKGVRRNEMECVGRSRGEIMGKKGRRMRGEERREKEGKGMK